MKIIELILPSLLAVIVHEAGHLIMMLLLGVKFRRARYSLWGIKITADYMKSSSVTELFVSLAGSFSNFILAFPLFFADRNEYGYAMVAYGAFNLFPADFLDGGEILRLILQMCKTDDYISSQICRCSSGFITVILWIMSVYVAIKYNSATILLSVFYMIFVSFCAEDS